MWYVQECLGMVYIWQLRVRSSGITYHPLDHFSCYIFNTTLAGACWLMRFAHSGNMKTYLERGLLSFC